MAESLHWVKVGCHWNQVSCFGARCVGADVSADGQTLLLLIPGVPGACCMYSEFASLLLRRLDRGDLSIWCPAHTNHVTLPVNLKRGDAYSKCGNTMESQIAQKLRFIRENVPKEFRIIVVAHSAGSYMMLNILPRLLDDGFKIARMLLLCPVIERIAQTQKGRTRLLWRKWHMDLVFYYGFSVMQYLPSAAAQLFLRYLWFGRPTSAPVLRAAADSFSDPSVVCSAFQLGADMLDTMGPLDKRLLRSPIAQHIFYLYVDDDPWCCAAADGAANYGRARLDDVPPGRLRLLGPDAQISHAFFEVQDETERMVDEILPLLLDIL